MTFICYLLLKIGIIRQSVIK